MRLSEEKTVSNARIKVPPAGMRIATVMVVSLLVTFIGIFVIAEWAETATWHHGLQHVLIFLGGAGFGGSLMYLISKESSHEG